ncbi:hypothetical protein [Arthrobacter psychrochitiniphilus]|uniref:hypothetical protein n=1 Tax=Arthrobacter psychrochitiniphilus TaxID=291045 RepID=UPI003F7C1FA3
MNADGAATEAQKERWAKNNRFSMSYGVPAFLAGWFVTYVVCCVGLTITNGISDMTSPGAGGFGLGFLILALIFGLPIAVIVGLPLAALVAWPLRRVRDQRLHVLAFAVALGAVMAGYVLLTGDGKMEAMALP